MPPAPSVAAARASTGRRTARDRLRGDAGREPTGGCRERDVASGGSVEDALDHVARPARDAAKVVAQGDLRAVELAEEPPDPYRVGTGREGVGRAAHNEIA